MSSDNSKYPFGTEMLAQCPNCHRSISLNPNHPIPAQVQTCPLCGVKYGTLWQPVPERIVDR